MRDIKNQILEAIFKIGPPALVIYMAKMAHDYSKGKRLSFLNHFVIFTLAMCGGIIGYWITKFLGWKDYKMVLTICACSLFADKFFEYVFSKTFLHIFLNTAEDATKEMVLFWYKKMFRKGK